MDVYTERMSILSSMALDLLIDGGEYMRNGDKEKAIECYAISWGFNSYQEFSKGMIICDKLLLACGVVEEDIPKIHEYGSEMVRHSIDITLVVGNVLNEQNPFTRNLNLPKDFL